MYFKPKYKLTYFLLSFHSQILVKCLGCANTKVSKSDMFSGPREANHQSNIPFGFHESSELTVYECIALTLQTRYFTSSKYLMALNFSISCVKWGLDNS